MRLLFLGVVCCWSSVAAFSEADAIERGDLLDEERLLEDSAFKIRPERLIELTKEVIYDAEFGVKDPSVLADDFQFNFPIVGPLTKDEYVSAVAGFNLKAAFPDLVNRNYGFLVDPVEPNRCWFLSRAVGKHSQKGDLPFKVTNITVEAPPQMNSFRFNEDAKVIEFTGGYVVDKNIGNTGGLGGVFGIFYAIGHALPFPEAQPYRRSLRFRFFNFISQVTSKLFGKKKDSAAPKES